MKAIAVILALALSGCASQTFYAPGASGPDGRVALKAFQNYGDISGNIDMVITGNSIAMRIEQPTGNVPIARQLVLDKKGNVVGVNEMPMLAGINNSRVNESLFEGIYKTFRGLGHAAGTILSGWMGIEAVKGAAQASIAASNAASSQHAASEATKQAAISAKAGVASERIAAGTKEAAIAAKAGIASEGIQAGTRAMRIDAIKAIRLAPAAP